MNMTLIGKVIKDAVILPPDTHLPEGTEARVEWEEAQDVRQTNPPVGRKLLSLAGIAKGLPADLAENHDHSLYGLPRRTDA